MGRVVNKSFDRVRKDIANKSEALVCFLQEHNGTIWGEWTTKQNKIYERLATLCDGICEEVENLDEIEVPDYEKIRR